MPPTPRFPGCPYSPSGLWLPLSPSLQTVLLSNGAGGPGGPGVALQPLVSGFDSYVGPGGFWLPLQGHPPPAPLPWSALTAR